MSTHLGFIERLVAAALRQRLFVLFCLAAVILTGVVAWRQLPVEAFPDLTNNQVVIVTEAPALAAPEVEQRVTYPIEIAMMGAPNTEQVRSVSKFGLSIVTVVFDDAVPIYFARQLVAERLADARGRLPEGSEPVLGPVATAFGEIYQYLIEGPDDPMSIKTLHDWDIRTRLRSVRGVGEVNSWGGLTRQYHIVVDPARLERHKLSLRQVYEAIAANNASFSGGYIEHSSERYTVRGVGLAANEADLQRIVLKASDGSPIAVGDVADVTIAPMARQGAVTYDGKGESIAGMVIMLKGENGRDVAARVKTRMTEVETQLPKGFKIVPFYDQSEVIARTSQTVRKNLIEGCLLVVVVLFIFLRDVRAALIVAAVIPLSMLMGFIGMRIFGVSANLMSLGAVDFGLIVDGAVVMMENFVRRRPEMAAALTAGDPGAHQSSAHRGRVFTAPAIEVARPVLFGVLIIIAVYLPVFTLEGLEGKMFRPMAITICSALFGALLLSLTAVPVASSYLLKLGGSHHEGPWFERFRERYVAFLEGAMNRRWRTLGAAVLTVTAAIASIPFLGTEFMPKLDEGSILIETRKYPSVSLAESVAISTRIEQTLRAFPEVRQVVTKLGRPDLATEAMGIYQGDVYVQVHEPDDWTTGRHTKEELIEAMSASLAEYPGMTFNFTQPMAMRLDEVVSGVKADVAVKVFGPDADELQRVGDQIRQVLSGVEGSADVQMEILSGAAQIQIDIDRGAIARYGLNVVDVQEAVEMAVGGRPVTEILDGARRFDVVMRFPERHRTNLTELAGVPLLAAGGERIPLGRVAKLAETSAPEAINHENGERRIVVQTNVRGRDVGSFVSEAGAALAARVKLPEGYYITWGGQFENQQRAMARLTLVIPLSIVIIFVLLFITFQRLRQAALVLLNVPFALIGGIAALWIGGLTLNLSAAVGFIALFGVAVLNGVVLVTAINRLRSHGEAIRPAVLQGAATRLKPVLMTALVEVIGLSPIVLSTGAGSEVQRPFASVISGGIVTATLLTLIVLPTLYEMIERRGEARRAG